MKKSIKLFIFAKSIDGGTGTFVLDMFKIKRLFPECSVITKVLVLEEPNYRKLNQTTNKQYIFLRKRSFYPPLYSFSLRLIWNFIEEILWLRKNINDFNPDIILSVDFHCNMLSIINKRLFFSNLKVIATTHIYLTNAITAKASSFLGKILKIVVRFSYQYADALVCVSRDLTQKISNDFNLHNKISTIYYGLSPSKIERKTPADPIVLTIGRLVNQKDYFTLIKAFDSLVKKIPNSKLWILGDGPLKQPLMDYVQTMDMKKKVIFYGWINNIYQYIVQSTIFVLSSKIEGFGYVLIEAMSQGIPVISTDTKYGPSEILDHGKYGLLVPIGSPKQLTSAMLDLLENKKRYDYFVKQSLIRSKYFSENKMLSAYKQVILKLINNK